MKSALASLHIFESVSTDVDRDRFYADRDSDGDMDLERYAELH